MDTLAMKRSVDGREGTLLTLRRKLARVTRHKTGSVFAAQQLSKDIEKLNDLNRQARLVLDLTDYERAELVVQNSGPHSYVDLKVQNDIEFLQCRGCSRTAKSKSEMSGLYCSANRPPMTGWSLGDELDD